MNLHVCLYAILFMTLFTPLYAGTVTGLVTDRQGAPLANASIFVETAARGAMADATGRYRLEGLSDGRHVVVFSMLGFRTERRHMMITIGAGEIVLNVTLTDIPIDLGEIIVSADKRPERIALVPAAITAIASRELDDLGVRERGDLSGLAPNLFMGQTGSHLSDLINIRGMFPATPFNATAMLYFDGVPVYGYGMNPVHLNDVERIEVIRGPQPLLYGRNALAGVINVVSRKPGNLARINAEIGYGSHADTRLQVGAEAPILNDLFVRASAFHSSRDGAYTNTTLDLNAGGADAYGGMASIRYFPSEDFDIQLSTRLEHLDESIWPFAASPEAAMQNPYHFEADVDSRVRKTNTLAALKLHGRLGSVDAFLTGSYQGITGMDWLYDADFSGLDIIAFRERGGSRTYTGELRFESTQPSQRFGWRGGLFFCAFDNTDDYGALLGEIWAAANNIPIWPLDQHTDGTRTSTSYALFGELSYRIGNRLTAAVGARAEREELRVDTRTRFLYQGAPAPIPAPPFNETELNNQERAFDFISPTFTLRYTIDEASTLYARIARGVHGGGFNSGANTRIPSFDPEYCWSYEAGGSAQALGNRLRANLSAFFIDWRKQQLLVVGDLSSPLQTITNAGRTSIRGLELECHAMPLRGLVLSLVTGVLDATLDEYQFRDTRNGRDSLYDYSGNSLPGAPAFSSHASVRYEYPLMVFGISTRLSAVCEYQYTDPHAFSHLNIYRSSARHLLDGKIAFASGGIEVSLWARNLLDHRYITSVYEFRGGAEALMALPRTIGTTLRVSFD